MKHSFAVALAAIALTAVPAASASACSVVGDYRVPTNLELAEGAELIMLGRVISEKRTEGKARQNAILVQPLSAIKGTLPTAPIELEGMSLTEGGAVRYGVLSNPYELAEAHPVSYIGGCIRYFFPRGTTALFFLERGDAGQWRSSGDAFSRWAEDVLTEDAPWLRLTRFYAKVAAAPAGARKGMLEVERDRLAALGGGDPVAHLMAEDVGRQLEGPNQPWNAIMQRAISGEEEIGSATAAEATAHGVAEALTEQDLGAYEVEITEGGDGYTAEAAINLEPNRAEDEGQAEAMEEQE